MTVTRLYHPYDLRPGLDVELDRAPSHHLVRVMRCKKNAAVILFNGDGHEYMSTLVDDNPKSCILKVESKQLVQRESPLHITLLQGISRGDRMDTCIQKSTELGISRIAPLSSERSSIRPGSDRMAKKRGHWQQIVISACEQSGRCVLPELLDVQSFDQAVTSIECELKLVLDPDADSTLAQMKPPNDCIALLIGPESGFSKAEIERAKQAGFHAIRLGPRILRTETAAPACLSAIQALWGDI